MTHLNGHATPHRTFASDKAGYYKGDSAHLPSLTAVPDILAKIEDGRRITYTPAVGSAGAALLGTATVLTAIGGRNISGQGDHTSS